MRPSTSLKEMGMLKAMLASLSMISISLSVSAQMLPSFPTAQEMMWLPEYCKVRATDNHKLPEFKYWETLLGRPFLSIHHYCAGINHISRYRRLVNDEKREYYLSRAIPEIDVVARGMSPDFPLAGDIYLNRGIALKLLNKDAEAILDLNKSIERNANQAEAYAVLAEIHVRLGNKNRALEVIVAGINNIPNNKMLQKRYIALGGKEPVPGLLVSSDSSADDAGASHLRIPSATSNPQGATENKALQSRPVVDGVNAPSALGSAAVRAGEDGGRDYQESQPTIKGNPYCRFCP